MRYLAAEDLLKFSDNSGYPQLLALVQSSDLIEGADGVKDDVRVRTGRVLGQFRQVDATQSIETLYEQTKNGELIVALQKLAPDKVGKMIPSTTYYNDYMALLDYGVENDRQFLPQITSSFHSSPNTEVKAAAAWALATMTGDQNAIDYLVQAAQPGINAKTDRTATFVSKQAVRYLGCLQNPQVKQVLETALDSSDPTVVRNAAVNLIFNQGGSSKVNQLVAATINGKQTPMGIGFALDLANQLPNDPQIQAASEAYSQRDGSWQRFVIEKKTWSLYNWVDGYVVKLNR